MKLKHIKTTECPDCGCNVIVYEEIETNVDQTKLRRHTNGKYWEHRRFLCGYKISYIPNFQGEEKTRPCTKSEEYLEKLSVEKKLNDKIAKLQRELSDLHRM